MVFHDVGRCAAMAVLVCVAAPAASQEVAPDASSLAGIVADWLGAPHGNYHSPSFTYWNEAGEVPESCAACHSEPGFIDFLGADGSSPGMVNHPAAINSPIGCAACHTGAAHALDSVQFPSGVRVDDLGASAVCTVCHQGRQSGDSVAAAVGEIGEDTVSPDLGFINIHYAIAAATLQGADVRAGFHYPGRSYAGQFMHVPSANTCVDCHDVHTTAVATDGCMSCHRGVENLTDIRTRHTDFDGDGDIAEGIHGEIVTLQARLGDAIRAYAAQVIEAPIGYAPGTFPYFFNDSDGDGQIDATEAVMPNRYQSWTPRLVKAAYNFQVAAKDPGGYVHNPTYMLQLLYDSLQSMAERVPLDVSAMRRP